MNSKTGFKIPNKLSIIKCNYDHLCNYINDQNNEFGVDETLDGEVPTKDHVANNIDSYINHSLAIKYNGKFVGIIFLREIYSNVLELSIIIKKISRNKNILNSIINLEGLNREILIGILNRFIKGYNIITSVTMKSSLERMLKDLGFKLKCKSTMNDKAIYYLFN